jgi:hypothetical protein
MNRVWNLSAIPRKRSLAARNADSLPTKYHSCHFDRSGEISHHFRPVTRDCDCRVMWSHWNHSVLSACVVHCRIELSSAVKPPMRICFGMSAHEIDLSTKNDRDILSVIAREPRINLSGGEKIESVRRIVRDVSTPVDMTELHSGFQSRFHNQLNRPPEPFLLVEQKAVQV